MKKSEELRIEAGGIDSDIKYLGVANKIMREERMERFIEKYLPLLEKKAMVTIIDLKDKIVINNGQFGVIDFYPKANKILIRSKNKWIKPGLQWLIKNFELK
jgi:hypothetical protein